MSKEYRYKEGYPKQPQKRTVVNSSKYEGANLYRENKKYWKSVLAETTAKHTSPSRFTESGEIAEVLPNDLYFRVCDTLQIPKVEVEVKSKPSKEAPPRRLQKDPMISYRTTLHVDRELDSDTDVNYSDDEKEAPPNCHWELLRKPLREMIHWKSNFLEPEKEDEKNLVTKSDDVTNRIATEFCQYMTELGGNQQSQLFTPEAIKELFQIEFDTHVARGLQVVPKEIPAVLESIAKAAGCPEKSQLAVLEREVAKDIKVEARPDITQAFATRIPDKEQWVGPKNNTKVLWRSAKYVPRDLVTLKTVWEGITNLRSVREYCSWMIEHPEYRRAPYLRSVGMFDPVVLHSRATFELHNKDIPSSIMVNTTTEAIHKRLSKITEQSIF